MWVVGKFWRAYPSSVFETIVWRYSRLGCISFCSQLLHKASVYRVRDTYMKGQTEHNIGKANCQTRQSSSLAPLLRPHTLLGVPRLQGLTTVLPGYFSGFMQLVTLRTGSRYAVKAVDSSPSVFLSCMLGIHPGPLHCPCGTRDKGNCHKHADVHSAGCVWMLNKILGLWPKSLVSSVSIHDTVTGQLTYWFLLIG